MRNENPFCPKIGQPGGMSPTGPVDWQAGSARCVRSDCGSDTVAVGVVAWVSTPAGRRAAAFTGAMIALFGSALCATGLVFWTGLHHGLGPVAVIGGGTLVLAGVWSTCWAVFHTAISGIVVPSPQDLRRSERWGRLRQDFDGAVQQAQMGLHAMPRDFACPECSGQLAFEAIHATTENCIVGLRCQRCSAEASYPGVPKWPGWEASERRSNEE